MRFDIKIHISDFLRGKVKAAKTSSRARLSLVMAPALVLGRSCLAMDGHTRSRCHSAHCPWHLSSVCAATTRPLLCQQIGFILIFTNLEI